MGLSCWNEGSDSDHVRGVNRDIWLVGHRKILAWQLAKLPRYGREGAVEVRPFPAKKRLLVSEAQGLSVEAMKVNPPTTVILRVDESKSSPRTIEGSTEPNRTINPVQRSIIEVKDAPDPLAPLNRGIFLQRFRIHM